MPVTYEITPDDESMIDSGSVYMLHYVYTGLDGSVASRGSHGRLANDTGLKVVTTNFEGANTYADYVAIHGTGLKLFSAGYDIKLTLGHFQNRMQHTINGKYGRSYFDETKITKAYLYLYDASGNETVIEDFKWSVFQFTDDTDYQLFDVYMEIPAQEFDIYRISMRYEFTNEAYGASQTDRGDWRSYGIAQPYVDITMKEYDESTGLLSGIIEWLRSIKEGITGLGDKIKGVYDSIVALPAQLWQKISDGLKSLFIPSEDAMTGIKDDWDGLLASRFGAVYQAGDIMVDFASGFREQTASETITVPSVSVDLAGTDFTFGGYDVPIIPQGFDGIVSVLKGAIDIIATLAFVEGLRKKYDDIMRG